MTKQNEDNLMSRMRNRARIFLLALMFLALMTEMASAASSLSCLKPTDIGIDNILSVRPVRGPLKSLLGRCGLLSNVETVRYFSEKALDRGALIGLGSSCVRWVYYLNLADLLQLVKSQSCPR